MRSLCTVALPRLWGGLVLTWFGFLFGSASPYSLRPLHSVQLGRPAVWGGRGSSLSPPESLISLAVAVNSDTGV